MEEMIAAKMSRLVHVQCTMLLSCHVICCTCIHYNALYLTCCSVDCAVRCCICVDIVYCMCLWGCLRCPWSLMTQSNLSLFGAFSSVYIMHLNDATVVYGMLLMFQ